MIVQTEFTYKGVHYQVGDLFDLDLLEDEDHNDIFMRRNFGQAKVESEKVHYDAKPTAATKSKRAKEK